MSGCRRSSAPLAPLEPNAAGLAAGRDGPVTASRRTTGVSAAVTEAAPRPTAARPGDSQRCKGSHVIQSRAWINERLGEGTFEKLVAHEGEVWTLPLLPSSWYDVVPLVTALRQVASRIGSSVQEVTREIARRNGLNDLKTLYRVFLTIAAPDRVLAFTPQLWSTYVKFGEARVIENAPGHYLGECNGVPAPLVDWACGYWVGFLPAIVEVTGGHEVRGRIVKRWTDQPGGTFVLQCEVDYQP